jgi:protein-disulfide isomerase
VKKLIDEDRNIRFVYKEFPILGPESVIAARAALAAQQQGRYKVFHDALMASSARLTETAVFETAGRLGLDVGKLRTDMRAPAIEAAIDANYRLARLLGINGTPAFIIGTELVPGAVDLSTLEELVAKARQK